MARKTTTHKAGRAARPSSPQGLKAAVSGVPRRALRLAGWVLPGLILVILALRFVPPPTSAFMLVCRAERLLDRWIAASG